MTGPRSRADGLLWLWAAAVVGFLYLPILVVIGSSFNTGRFLLNWDGFGTAAYASALANGAIRDAILLSLRVALTTAGLSVVLGGFAGLALARRPGRWGRPFGASLMLILVAPEIMVAVAYLIFFVRIELTWGVARLVVAHSIFGSAVVALIVRAHVLGLDEALEEAAADLGASPSRVFLEITLPLMTPALIAGGLLAFTFSLDDVVIASFVSTSGSTTLPAYIFSSLRTGLKTELAGMATLALAVTLLALGLTAVVLRRRGTRVGVVGSVSSLTG